MIDDPTDDGAVSPQEKRFGRDLILLLIGFVIGVLLRFL